MLGATSLGRHTFRAAFKSGQNLKDGELPGHEIFQLGGFLQLSGYKTGQLIANDYRFARLVYNYRLSGPGFLDGMYAGASIETARMTNVAFLTPAQRSRRHGGSLYFALDTPIGPLYVAAGFADSGRRAAYLYLGQP